MVQVAQEVAEVNVVVMVEKVCVVQRSQKNIEVAFDIDGSNDVVFHHLHANGRGL